MKLVVIGAGVTGVTTLASHLVLGDDDEIRLGASTDITLKHHNSGYGHLENTGTLYVDADKPDILEVVAPVLHA